MYFVVLCMTKSAPNSRGRKNTGVANVESTPKIRLRSLAIFPTASRSVTFSNGLVGVSAQIIFVSLRIAFLTLAALELST